MRLLLACAALALVATTARADEADETAAKSTYRVVIDRADLQPSAMGGARLSIFIDATSLAGPVLDLEPAAFALKAGSSKLEDPFFGRFATTDVELAIAVVVETTSQYETVLPAITDALNEQIMQGLAPLGDRVHIAVIGYGEAVATSKLGNLKAAAGELPSLTSDGTAGEPVLADAVDHAMKLLKKAKTDPVGRPLRKVLVVIGDGRDISADRDRVTTIGERAAKDGIRIHTFAFAPDDIRRPLLNLGELSKRSFGTFRWVRRADSWGPELQQLRDQIMHQYVLTYLVGDGMGGKELSVELTGRIAATSLDDGVKTPKPSCNGAECDAGYCALDSCVIRKPPAKRGIVGWVLRIVGIAVGAIVLLGIIGAIITKRQNRPKAPPRPMPVPGSFPPGMKFPAGMQLPPGFQMPSQPPAVAPVAAPVPASQPPVVAPRAPAPAAGPRFYVMSGPRTGQELPLHNGFTIGKAPGSNFEIDDGYTSAQHAQIGLDNAGNARIYDRNSTNGTYVNGTRINEYHLEHGMTVRIGSTELRFLAQ